MAIAQPDANQPEGIVIISSPIPTDDAERPENDGRVWPIFFREILSAPGPVCIRAARQIRLPSGGSPRPYLGALLVHIRQAKQQQQRVAPRPADFPSVPQWRQFWPADAPRVFRPCISPTTARMGRPAAPSTSPWKNMVRTAGVSLPRSRCCPCARRADKQRAASETRQWPYESGGKGRRVKDDRQPVLRNNLSVSMVKPCGVCIQLLDARIQKVDISVPSATMQVEKKCRPVQPYSSRNIAYAKRKPASRKKSG